jgi:hypothetical protein
VADEDGEDGEDEEGIAHVVIETDTGTKKVRTATPPVFAAGSVWLCLSRVDLNLTLWIRGITPSPLERDRHRHQEGPQPYTLHPSPYTLHPTPYTLHLTPYALHPTPYTLRPTPYSLLPTP